MEPVEPRRRPGRPRSTEAKGRVSAWIPERHHDRLARIALSRGVSVSSIVAYVLEHALDKSTPKPE